MPKKEKRDRQEKPSFSLEPPREQRFPGIQCIEKLIATKFSDRAAHISVEVMNNFLTVKEQADSERRYTTVTRFLPDTPYFVRISINPPGELPRQAILIVIPTDNQKHLELITQFCQDQTASQIALITLTGIAAATENACTTYLPVRISQGETAIEAILREFLVPPTTVVIEDCEPVELEEEKHCLQESHSAIYDPTLEQLLGYKPEFNANCFPSETLVIKEPHTIRHFFIELRSCLNTFLVSKTVRASYFGGLITLSTVFITNTNNNPPLTIKLVVFDSREKRFGYQHFIDQIVSDLAERGVHLSNQKVRDYFKLANITPIILRDRILIDGKIPAQTLEFIIKAIDIGMERLEMLQSLQSKEAAGTELIGDSRSREELPFNLTSPRTLLLKGLDITLGWGGEKREQELFGVYKLFYKLSVSYVKIRIKEKPFKLCFIEIPREFDQSYKKNGVNTWLEMKLERDISAILADFKAKNILFVWGDSNQLISTLAIAELLQDIKVLQESEKEAC